MSKPKWKKFEELVAKIQRDLAPNAKVTLDDKIQGKLTERKRQVDISIRKKVGQFEILIAIDCKDLATPVDVKDVEGVIGLIEDIQANQGAIVSASGFTATALGRGRKAGLSLYRLVDCGDHDWKVEVTIPVLYDYREMKNFRLVFSLPDGVSLPKRALIPSGDFRELEVYDLKNRSLGKIGNLLMKRWNERKVPTKPGKHENVDFIGQPVRVRCEDQFFDIGIKGILKVNRDHYFANLPLTKMSGFKDEIQGGVVTRGFTTSVIDVVEVPENSQKLDSVDQLAVKPVMTFVFLSCYEIQSNESTERT